MDLGRWSPLVFDRQAAIQHLKDIAETFGSQWTVEHLLPKLVEQYSGSVGYANRVTTCGCKAFTYWVTSWSQGNFSPSYFTPKKWTDGSEPSILDQLLVLDITNNLDAFRMRG